MHAKPKLAPQAPNVNITRIIIAHCALCVATTTITKERIVASSASSAIKRCLR